MDILVKLGQLLLSLSLLIILHELGHFVPAKLFKTRVEKFYLFFDVKFSLFKKKIGETVYGIGWLPLGGYVKISGMVDESMDTDQMKKEPQPWEFRSKKAWQRLIIMLGGVIVNFIVAFLIYIGTSWFYGEQYIQNDSLKNGVWVVSDVLKEAGMKSGDRIVSIDGENQTNFNQAMSQVIMAKTIKVDRNGTLETIILPEDFISSVIENKSAGFIHPRIPFIVGGFSDESQNKKILETKDIIKSINGTTVDFYDQAKSLINKFPNQKIKVEVERKGSIKSLELAVNEKGLIGVAPARIPNEKAQELGLYKLSNIKYTFFEAIPKGFVKGKQQVQGYLKQLKMIFTPKTGAYKGVGGFKAMYDIFPTSWNWQVFWNITALLSIMLGVLNLLPIPALDGGHVIFLLYEIISGRKPSDKFLEYAQTVGFFLLLTLLIFANGNDILKSFK